MGLEVGFSFYKKKEVKDNAVVVEPVDVKTLSNNTDIYNMSDNTIWVCGRCANTYAFSDWVERHFNDCEHTGENRTYPEVILNDETLNGFIKENVSIDYNDSYAKAKLFYQTIEDLEDHMNFAGSQKEWEDTKERINSDITYIESEIEKLREYQTKAETKVAFNGFQEQIDNRLEELDEQKQYLKEVEEDDYEYGHAKWINEDIQEVKKIIENNPDILVVAWTSY